MKKLFYLLALCLSPILFANSAPEFELKDSEGNSHKLSDYKGKIVVMEFINYDCPFVKKHYDASGNIPKLQKHYKDEGVIWLSICSSGKGKQGNYSAAELKKIQQSNGASPSAYLLDEDGIVGKAFSAKVTPHIFIVDKSGKLVYQGGIDSKKSTQASDIDKAEPYVKNALDELIQGKPVSKEKTKHYGCGVKYAK
ncbi:thioredoxin family protein [Lentisphaera profundi]|uniref:Thioredoxin family protein n=1 Tax=Lentisphaera profundi TaxID=1658616 RepID=A0ABY7VNV4_9BACT|nr:thioredoxin family protein [Lentisphaera profundi]WDE95461.1 thioredoxin family protein [Lentisphaera profundi]